MNRKKPNTISMSSDVFEKVAKHYIENSILSTSEEILAEVLKWRFQEFQGMEREEIISCIELNDDPQSVLGMTNITSQNGRIFCDILFTASVPDKPEDKLDITAELNEVFSPDTPLFAGGISFMVKRGSDHTVQYLSPEEQLCDEIHNTFCVCITFNSSIQDTIMKVNAKSEMIHGKKSVLDFFDRMQTFLLYLRIENNSDHELAGMLGNLFNKCPYNEGE